MQNRYCVMTSKQTTKQHPLLGNRFSISKYTQPLLNNASQTNMFPWKRQEYNNQQYFLLGLCQLERHASDPCGGGFEYLHRDSSSRRRRRKGKSQIWESKIWSRVKRDSDPRKTTLARTSSIYKRQTRHLVRDGTPEKQDRDCQKSSRGSTPRLTNWLTISSNVTLTLTGIPKIVEFVQVYVITVQLHVGLQCEGVRMEFKNIYSQLNTLRLASLKIQPLMGP
jgi:hypothetical protein